MYNTSTTVATTAGVDAPTAAQAPQDFAALGEAAFHAGDYQGAAKNFRHALVDDPENATLVLLLSQSLFATGQFEEAAGAAQSALQQIPKENWNVVVANYKELYGNQQDYTDQLRALETASEKTASPALQFLLGYHYGYLGYPREAVRELDKGLKLMPQDTVAQELRGVFNAQLSPATTPANPPLPKS